jgi:hypothetical protein
LDPRTRATIRSATLGGDNFGVVTFFRFKYFITKESGFGGYDHRSSKAKEVSDTRATRELFSVKYNR